MWSLDRSSEQLHQPSLWSRTVRLTFLLCRGKETASPVRGQGGYTHHHPGWPAAGPGGHTCPGRSRSQCAARCSCKTHRTASDGTHSLPLQPTPPFLSLCFRPPPLTWTNSPSLLPAFPSPVSFSSSSLCSHQDDLLKAQEPLQALHCMTGVSIASSQPPSQSHTSLPRASSRPAALGYLPPYKQSARSCPCVSARAVPSAWNSPLPLNHRNYCLLSIYCMLCPLHMYLSLNSQTNHMENLPLSQFTNKGNKAQRTKWQAPSHTPHNEE